MRAAEAALRVGVCGPRPAPAALAGVAEPPPRRRADDAVAALVHAHVARVAVDERARVRAAAADGADLAVTARGVAYRAASGRRPSLARRFLRPQRFLVRAAGPLLERGRNFRFPRAPPRREGVLRSARFRLGKS